MQQDQTVQWFPGHMARTRRQIRECLPLVDAVTELLVARIPESSKNPELSALIGNKPRIVLLNKCDLADAQTTKQWLSHFEAMGAGALAVDCRSGKGLNAYHGLVRNILADKIRANTEKGMAGKPGVTRQYQWFAIGNGIELLDTPGVLWPKFDDPKVGDRLAFIGSVKDEILDSELMAVRLLEVLQSDYADRLQQRYGILPTPDAQPWEVLEQLGRKRGMLVRGGEIDTERAANMLLDEYRDGRLGRISLEKP